jgi:exodeoxyribonuclease VII large subunit
MNDLFSDQVFSVSDITTLIKQTLEGAFYGVAVEGEVSNFRPASSGHWYFQLNDNDAAIQAVMFKQKSWRLSFIPKDGDRVKITGNISVYAKRGTYQLICESIEKTGTGDILALLEERKRRFAAAGYFDQARKRPLPPFPTRIGVVTSPTGAALRDILHVSLRRNPTIDIVVLPATVQGEGAAAMIAGQIAYANKWNLADVLIVGRGGGSLEDLLPFSEQVVVEAIVHSAIPVVSAVGHEIDWALSDHAADLRAPTPSAAAELTCPDIEEMVAAMKERVGRMHHMVRNRIALAKSETNVFSTKRMSEYFSRRLEQAHLRSDDLVEHMRLTIQRKVVASRSKFDAFRAQTHALSPLSVLERGYAIVTDTRNGGIVKNAHSLVVGSDIAIRFAKGSARATTQSIDVMETHDREDEK